MRLLARIALLPARVAGATLGASYTAGVRAGRLVGYRRLALIGMGVLIGLLVAPVPGRQLRARLLALVGRGRVSDDELAGAVERELSQAPRTWHLPQPAVDVRDGVVVLRGDVPHETARRDLEQAASAVDGVVRVESRLSLPDGVPG
ncbi:MAG: BON domain-containing protein [Acidimicrobiales bacterium]|nr:BON domain-containing protein [Acidimicrobiales bacterium]